MEPDPEDAARQIAASARAQRRPWPRWVWGVAIAVACTCLGALAYGLLTAPDAKPLQTPQASTPSSGFATGAVIGLAVGVVLGWVIARRATART